MMQPVYILSSCAITAQHTFEPGQFLQNVQQVDNGKLYVADIDYTKFVSPVAIRRMSRLLKRGISAGMRCMQEAGVTTPDAIITGTAHSSVSDMQQVIKDITTWDEGTLNPTFFIQSTSNSINGWLAMQTKCKGYNQTYVHRGHSFELAMFDAQMLLQEATAKQHILVGGYDELTEEFFHIRNKKDYWKKDIPPSLNLLQHNNTPGTIAGEGAVFFTVSNEPANATCAVKEITMLLQPTPSEFQDAYDGLLAAQGLEKNDIDVLLCGMNGDSRSQPLFDTLISNLSENTNVAAYKHLSGEYDTSTAFALWVANRFFIEHAIPTALMYKEGSVKQFRNIIICNNSILGNASLILVTACS